MISGPPGRLVEPSVRVTCVRMQTEIAGSGAVALEAPEVDAEVRRPLGGRDPRGHPGQPGVVGVEDAARHASCVAGEREASGAEDSGGHCHQPRPARRSTLRAGAAPHLDLPGHEQRVEWAIEAADEIEYVVPSLCFFSSEPSRPPEPKSLIAGHRQRFAGGGTRRQDARHTRSSCERLVGRLPRESRLTNRLRPHRRA